MKVTEIQTNLVYLNGFLECTEYVKSLTNVIYVGETKSRDGYSFIPCFETIL